MRFFRQLNFPAAARLVILACALTWAFAAPAMEIEGVKLDARVNLAQGVPELQLNGAGVRTKFLVAKVYVGALYLPEKSKLASDIVQKPVARRMAMHVLQDEITAEQLISSLHDGLAANNGPAELAPIEGNIRELAGMMRQVGKVARGGVILIDFLPGIGTRVSVNGVVRLTVAGEEFNRALMKIWLGAKPVDGRLKHALLGGEGGLFPF